MPFSISHKVDGFGKRRRRRVGGWWNDYKRNTNYESDASGDYPIDE